MALTDQKLESLGKAYAGALDAAQSFDTVASEMEKKAGSVGKDAELANIWKGLATEAREMAKSNRTYAHDRLKLATPDEATRIRMKAKNHNNYQEQVNITREYYESLALDMAKDLGRTDLTPQSPRSGAGTSIIIGGDRPSRYEDRHERNDRRHDNGRKEKPHSGRPKRVSSIEDAGDVLAALDSGDDDRGPGVAQKTVSNKAPTIV